MHVKIDKARTGVDFLPVIRSLSEAGVRIMLTGARADEPAAPVSYTHLTLPTIYSV